MKQLLLIFLLLSSFASRTQSLQLVEEVSHTSLVSTHTEASTSLAISNVSAEPVRVAVRRIAEQLDQTQRASLCLQGDCTQDDQPLELTTLLPGESVADVVLRFSTGFVDHNSTVSYFIYNLDNPQDGFYHAMTYKILGDFPHGILFSQDNMKVGNAYPNPATTEANIDYTLTSFDGKAQIVVHNLLGNKVLELTLEAEKNQLRLSTDRLNDGVYFYSLYLNGKGVVTKKLVVRK